MKISKLFRRQFILEIILLATTALSISVVSAWYLHKNLLDQIERRTISIATSMQYANLVDLFAKKQKEPKIIQEFMHSEKISYLILLDKNNQVIRSFFSSTFTKEKQTAIEKTIKELGKKETIKKHLIIDGISFTHAFKPFFNGIDGSVHVGVDRSTTIDSIREAISPLVLMISSFFALSLYVSYTSMNRISIPLKALTDHAKRIAVKDFSSCLTIKSDDELGILADGMRVMEEEIQRSFEDLEMRISQATKKHKTASARLKTILNNLAEGLIATDIKGVITHSNSRLLEMLNQQGSDIIGKRVEDILGSSIKDLINRSQKEKNASCICELSINETKTAQAVSRAIIQPDTEESLGVVILIRDITKEKEVDQMKTEFISTVSHELRTPLTSILGFAKIVDKKLSKSIQPLIKEETEKDFHKIVKNISTIISEGERLSELVSDVLDISKMESGKLDYRRELLNANELIDQAIERSSSLFEKRDLKVVRECSDIHHDIVADKHRVIQVLINLLSNAVKFTPEGSIICKTEQRAEKVIFSIIDTGIGIEQKDHAKIFDRFKQVGNTLTSKPQGTGLGLPICKHIVNSLGGEIWMESKKGKGSTFSFSLPIQKIEKDDVTSV